METMLKYAVILLSTLFISVEYMSAQRDCAKCYQLMSQYQGMVLDYGQVKVKSLQTLSFSLTKQGNYLLVIKGMKGSVEIYNSMIGLHLNVEPDHIQELRISKYNGSKLFIYVDPKESKSSFIYLLIYTGAD